MLRWNMTHLDREVRDAHQQQIVGRFQDSITVRSVFVDPESRTGARWISVVCGLELDAAAPFCRPSHESENRALLKASSATDDSYRRGIWPEHVRHLEGS